MDGRQQSSEVPQGAAQQQKQQPQKQQEQQQHQQGQQQQLHGQHQRRYRQHYEQRMPQHHSRVQQLQCRSHASREHQEGKRGNNDAGLQFACEARPHIFRWQRSFVDKVPEAAAPKARTRLFARSRSTPWSLDEKDQPKIIQGNVEIVTHPEGFIQASSHETTAAGDERCRVGFPAAARLRRLHSHGSVDSSNRSNHAGTLQTNISGINRRYVRCSSHATQKGGCVAGSSHNGNWCLSNNNISTNENTNASCTFNAAKGTQGSGQLRAFYKKSVSFDCSLNSGSKSGACFTRKDWGCSRPSLQQSVVQDYDSKPAEQQVQAADEGCDSKTTQEARCFCGSEFRHRHPDLSPSATGTAQRVYNSESPRACPQQQKQQQQQHQQQHQQQKCVHRRKLQQQKVLQQQQQTQQHLQQLQEQQPIERRQIPFPPERPPAKNSPPELVPTQQAPLQEQPTFSQDRGFPDSSRPGNDFLHSPTQRLRPFALHDGQNQQQHLKQHHQQQGRPQQQPLTQEIQAVPHQTSDCLPPAYYYLQWPPSPSLLYCRQVQQLQAGSSSFYEKEMNSSPDRLLRRLLLHVPDNLDVSSQHVYSGSAGPPSLLQLRVAAAQRSCVRDTCEALGKRVCLTGQTTSPFSSVSASQSSISPSASSPRPAGECGFCSSDIGKDEEQDTSLSKRMSNYCLPSAPALAAPFNRPASPAGAISSSISLPTHATRIEHSVVAPAQDEEYGVPTAQTSNRNWTAAKGSPAQRRNNPSHLPKATPLQHVRRPPTSAGCLKPEGSTVESESDSNVSATDNVTAAAKHACDLELFTQAAVPNSFTGNAADAVAGTPSTVAAYSTSGATCVCPADETPNRNSTHSISDELLRKPSCGAGCLCIAGALALPSSKSARSDQAVRYERAHEEDEGSQRRSSNSALRLSESTTQCTARGGPLPFRFPLAFPPKDKRLLLPPGAPLVAASSGTTNGGVDNKDHEYIARQYEFIFPDHLLAVAAPLVTSGPFPQPTGATKPLSPPVADVAPGSTSSAPTAVAASTAAAGASGCAAAPPAPAESVVDTAAAGVLNSVTQMDHQTYPCSAAAAQVITEGSSCKADAKACVLSTVHAAGEQPHTPLLKHEGQSNKGSAVASLEHTNKGSGTKQTPLSVATHLKRSRAAAENDRGLDFMHSNRRQEFMQAHDEDRESRGSSSMERRPRGRQRSQKQLLQEDVDGRSSTDVEEADGRYPPVKLPVKGKGNAAAGLAREHIEKRNAVVQYEEQGALFFPRTCTVENVRDSTRPYVDVEGRTRGQRAVDWNWHETTNACARLYLGRGESKVEGARKTEKEIETEEGQITGKAAADSVAGLQKETQAKPQGVDSAGRPQAVQPQRKISARAAALELQRRAKSLPARSLVCFKSRNTGASPVSRNAAECSLRAAAPAVLPAAHQRAKDKGVHCAANTAAGNACGQTKAPCASLLGHANRHEHDTPEDTRAIKQQNCNFVPDEGMQLELPEHSPDASTIPAARKEIDEKAGEIEVREADAQSETKSLPLQERSRRAQEKSSTAEQEAHGCAPCGARVVSCQPYSPRNRSPPRSHNCRSSTTRSCSRERHRLHYYQVLRLLGRGTFGHVYECLQYDAYSGEAVAAVAVKIVKNDEAYTRSAMQEIAILRQLNGSSCKYNCNCKATPGALGSIEENSSSSRCVCAATGKTDTLSVGGGSDGGGGGRVHSEEERQCPQHQNCAGQQLQKPERQRREGGQASQQQADADLGKCRLVQLLDDFTHCGHTCLVFELLQTDLYQLLKKYRFSGFPLLAVKQVCRELLQGLAHLKRMGVVHCDLKPENILVRFSGVLPLQQQQQQPQGHQRTLKQQHCSSRRQMPVQQQQRPLLQPPPQQELQLLHQKQRSSPWRATSAAEEAREQQDSAGGIVPHGVPPASSTVLAAAGPAVSAKAPGFPENPPIEERRSHCVATCCGNGSSLTEKAVAAAVAAASAASNKATAANAAPDPPFLTEVCSAVSANAESLLPRGDSSSFPTDGACLPNLLALHAVEQTSTSDAEAYLSLPAVSSNGSLTCSTALACSASLNCISPVTCNQPVTSRTRSPSWTSSSVTACSSQHNAGDTLSSACMPSTACKRVHKAAQRQPAPCAVAPPPAATAAASSRDTCKKVQKAAGSACNTAAAADLHAAAATSPAGSLYISVKLVDFSSAYPLPSSPQPADPAAVEALAQDHSPHPAAPYLYAQSRFYGAPEVMLGVRYMKKLDVWAVGCVAAELYSGKPLLPGATDFDQMRRLVALRGAPPEWMLRVGRRTSLYFTRDKLEPQQQRLVDETREEEQRRLQQKDEEDKQHEQHQHRRQQHHEKTFLAPQEEQQQERMQKRRQQLKQQQQDDGVLLHKAVADDCVGMEDEETKKICGREQEIEKQQKPSLSQKNRNRDMRAAEGVKQATLLNSSCRVAGGTAAASAFVRGERWGALSAGPCGLPRRQIQAWLHRILIAVSSCATAEKKPQQGTYYRGLAPPQHQRQPAAESAHQQQPPAGAAQEQRQGQKQRCQGEAAGTAPRIHQQDLEECCQAAAARGKQQRKEAQCARTIRQTEESSFLQATQQRTQRGPPAAADYQQQTRVPLVPQPPVGCVEQTSAAKACTENNGKDKSNSSRAPCIMTCGREKRRGKETDKEGGGERRRGSLVHPVRDAESCAQEEAEKAASKGEVARPNIAANGNRAANRIWVASGEADAAQTCNEGRKELEEGNTDANTGGPCCSAEGSVWRLKTPREAGEGTSSREGTPRGGPVLRSLQDLLTMRKRREQLCRLQVKHYQAKLTKNGGPSVQLHIPGCCWPTTSEAVACERSAAWVCPLELEAWACSSQSCVSDEAKRHSVSVDETAAQSSAVSGACIKSAQDACGQICISSRNSHSQFYTVANAPRKKMPASGDASLLSSYCVRGARVGTATRIESVPQSQQREEVRVVARYEGVHAAGLTSDPTQERLFTSALPSNGVGEQQGGSGNALGSRGNADRIAAAARATRESSNENIISTISASKHFLCRSQFKQALSEELEQTKSMHPHESRLVNEKERSFSCATVEAFLCAEPSALTCATSSISPSSVSGSSAAASFPHNAHSSSVVPEASPKGRGAATAANSSILASASSSSGVQGDPTPPRLAAESPHQAPAGAAAATATVVPQAIVSMRDSLPKRASRFFKKLMKGRTSRPSCDNCSTVPHSKTRSAASPSQIASTYKQEDSSSPTKGTPLNSASSPPSALRAVSASSRPPGARPFPGWDHNGAAASSPCSAVSTQQTAESGEASLAAVSSHSPPPPGAAASFVSPAAALASAALPLCPVTSCTPVNFSSVHSSSNVAAHFQEAGRILPPLQSCSVLCSASPPACFPAAPTIAPSSSYYDTSAACISSDPAAPCSAVPIDPSFPAGVGALSPSPAGTAGALLPAAPPCSTVTAAAVSVSPAVAAAALPTLGTVSASTVDTFGDVATSCRPVVSSCLIPFDGAAAPPPFCSASAVVRAVSSSFPPFPPSGSQLRKDTSNVSTASSTTTCSCCSLQHVEPAATDAAAAADAQLAAAAATKAGGAVQKQRDTETLEEAEASSAPPGALEIAVPEEQAEDEREEHLFLDFLEGMLQVDPFKRFTVEEALRHPFIAEDFHVAPPVAVDPPTTAAALPAAATPAPSGTKTVAIYPVGEGLPAAAMAPRETAAFRPAATAVDTTTATGDAAHTVAPALRQKKNAAVQQEQHSSPSVSELAIVHSLDAAAARTSATAATRDPQIAPAHASKVAPTSTATLLATDSLPTPLLHGDSQQQQISSSDDTATHKSPHLAAPASARRASTSSRSVLCCCCCSPAVAQDDASVVHHECWTAAAAAAPITAAAGAIATITGTPLPGVARTSGAAGAGVGPASGESAGRPNANVLAAVTAAPSAAVPVGTTPPLICPTSASAGLCPAFLRQRAVDEQYRIWNSRRFKDILQRLRDDAAVHRQATAAAGLQTGAAEEQEAAVPHQAKRNQRQSCVQQQTVHAGQQQRTLASGEEKEQEVKSQQERQDNSWPAASSRTNDAVASPTNSESCQLQECSVDSSCNSLFQKRLFTTVPGQDDTSRPCAVSEQCANISSDAALSDHTNGLISSGGESPGSGDSRRWSTAAAKGAAPVALVAVGEDTDGPHNSVSCHERAAKVRQQLQDKLLLHHVQNVLQEEALKARHLREQQDLRQRQIKELQELRRKRQLTFPINLVRNTTKNMPSFLHQAPTGG